MAYPTVGPPLQESKLFEGCQIDVLLSEVDTSLVNDLWRQWACRVGADIHELKTVDLNVYMEKYGVVDLFER